MAIVQGPFQSPTEGDESQMAIFVHTQSFSKVMKNELTWYMVQHHLMTLQISASLKLNSFKIGIYETQWF